MRGIYVSVSLISENNNKLRAAAQTVAWLMLFKAIPKSSFVDLHIVRFELDFVADFDQFHIEI